MTVFDGSTYYTGPELTLQLVHAAEQQLGYVLPAAYVRLLEDQNGGSLSRRCILTDFWTPSAPGFVEIRAIRGIGGEWGIDAESGGSAYLIDQWGYPPIGIVFCIAPAGAHVAVMLDYQGCGPTGEPSVAYIEEDRVPRTIAATFGDFVAALTDCPEVPDQDLYEPS